MAIDTDLDWMDELLSTSEIKEVQEDDFDVPLDIFDSKGNTVRHLNDIISVVQPDKRNEFTASVYTVTMTKHSGKTVRFRPVFDADGIPAMVYGDVRIGYIEVVNNKSRCIRVASHENYKDHTEEDELVYSDVVRLVEEYRTAFNSKDFSLHKYLLAMPVTIFRDYDGKNYDDPSFTFLISYSGRFLDRYLEFIESESKRLQEKGTSFVEEFFDVNGKKDSCIEVEMVYKKNFGYDFGFKAIYGTTTNKRMVYTDDLVKSIPSINKNYLCYDKYPLKEMKEIQKSLNKRLSVRNF